MPVIYHNMTTLPEVEQSYMETNTKCTPHHFQCQGSFYITNYLPLGQVSVTSYFTFPNALLGSSTNKTTFCCHPFRNNEEGQKSSAMLQATKKIMPHQWKIPALTNTTGSGLVNTRVYRSVSSTVWLQHYLLPT